MTRRKTFFTFALMFVLFLGGLAGLALLVNHEPSFYRLAEVAPGKLREELSSQFDGKKFSLAANYKEPPGPDSWEVVFTQEQINSFFAESFMRVGDDAKNLESQGITAPRVSIEKDRLRLAFRYQNALVNTIISFDLRVWIVPNETNVFAVEILGRHAGALPISVRAMQEDISKFARKYNLDATWYRQSGHPVALLRLKSKGQRPPTKFQRIELAERTLTISGASLELPTNAKTKLPPNTQLAPMGD